MIYDPKKTSDKEKATRKFNELINGDDMFELTSKKRATNNQNSYLHLILGWFSLEYGEPMEYCKEKYFKVLVNKDIFIRQKEDKFLGSIEIIRSTADLTREEKALAITRFRDWSNKEADIYLPEANEDKFLKEIEYEMSRNKRYL